MTDLSDDNEFSEENADEDNIEGIFEELVGAVDILGDEEMNKIQVCFWPKYGRTRSTVLLQILYIIQKYKTPSNLDVCTEPMLLPLSGETFPQSTNTEDEARLDIKARGFLGREEMAFFDVRIFNPFARSHMMQFAAIS